jgi:prepilin-type N-terminal cleavage/methylation domain-containing protein
MRNLKSQRSTPSLPRASAFTLIELLCVIALLGVLTVMALPAMSSLKGSGSVNHAALNISLLLEQARAHALANNIHVWVGFREQDNRLMVTSVAGLTGDASDISSSTTFRPLMKPRTFENIVLSKPDNFAGMPQAQDLAANSPFRFSQMQAGTLTSFDHVIEFVPSGGARLSSGSPTRWIQLGIEPTNGANNDAAIQVAGLTGQVKVFRR